MRVNRIALHQSTVHPLDPVALVEVARGAGLDSIGLRVAAVADVESWWSRGIGSPMLPDLIDALLAHRVTVLDVGRVPLGPELCVMDIGHPYGRVLELGTRLGAQFVTVRAGKPADDPADFFARLAELAARYHLRPLLSPAAGTAVATLEQAAAAVAGTGGGVVLDVVPGRDDGPTVDETVVELGDLLGYVRVPARALDHTVTPGLLATLPPQVPIAIGGAPGSTTTAPPTDSDPHAGSTSPGTSPARPPCAPRSTRCCATRRPPTHEVPGSGRASPDGLRQPAARLPAPAEACSRGSTASSRARPRAASTSAGTTRPSVACSRSGTSTPTAAIAVPGGPRTGTATPHRPGCSSPQLVAMPCSRTHCSARWMHSGVVRVAGVKAGSDGPSTIRTT